MSFILRPDLSAASQVYRVRHGVTLTKLRLLATIGHHQRVAINEISRLTGIDKACGDRQGLGQPLASRNESSHPPVRDEVSATGSPGASNACRSSFVALPWPCGKSAPSPSKRATIVVASSSRGSSVTFLAPSTDRNSSRTKACEPPYSASHPFSPALHATSRIRSPRPRARVDRCSCPPPPRPGRPGRKRGGVPSCSRPSARARPGRRRD